jgi:Helix-turn-helix domain
MASQLASDLERRYADVKHAAKILNVSASYLNKLRMTGDGPPFVKFGAAVRYPTQALMAWAEARTRTSTSDSREAA